MNLNKLFQYTIDLQAFKPATPCVWEAVAGATGSLLSGVLGSELSAKHTREQQLLQHKLNMEEMDYQDRINRSYQDMLWNSAQVKQVSGMLHAGLNPAFDGAASSPVASNSVGSGASGPVAPLPDMGNPVNSALQAESFAADLEIKKAQADALKADANLKDEQASWQAFQNTPAYRDATLKGVQNESLKSWFDALSSEKDVAVKDSQIANLAAQTQLLGKKLQLTDYEMRNLQAQTALTYSRISEVFQGIEESKARIIYNRAAASAQRAAASMYYQQGNYYDSSSELNKHLGDMYDEQKYMYNQIGNKTMLERNQMEERGKSIPFENAQKQVEVELTKYYYDVLNSYDPSTRAYMQFVKDGVSIFNPATFLLGRFSAMPAASAAPVVKGFAP